jgi:abnormal spindle-like microcephaly-associated protein
MISTGEEDGTTAVAGSSSSSRAAYRLAAKMRGRLWKIYTQDTELRDVMLRVEQRLDRGQLKAKNAEAALSGVRESSSVRKSLAAFHPVWLRLAAEIAVGRPSKAIPLDAFMKNYVLADKALLLEHKGVRTAEYWSDLGALVTKRILLIIALLDRAGIKNGLASAYPLIFKPACGISSSADALQAAAGSLLGEVEVGRHLGRLGYKVSYAQTPRQEINFKVKNLAIDMRDGLRLCRLVDQAVEGDTQGCLLLEKARFPAERRPDRIFNIELALKALKNSGMDITSISCHSQSTAGSTTLAAAIVNGDRSATLSLLWRLVLQHDLPRLAGTAELNMEIDHLGLRTPQLESLGVDGELAADAGRSVGNVTALLHWMSAVTSKYGVHVANFDEDVADGSAFCILVHHYLGSAHMPLASIVKSSQNPTTHDIRENFTALQTAAETLGVPMIITADDFLASGGADTRAVTLFTATLCHRLIETNREHRAAMVIQRRWRQRGAYKPGTARQHLHSWIAASSVIQRNVRVFLLRRGLQQFIQDKRKLEVAVTKLQAAWRGRSSREEFLASKAAVITIQTAWRGVMARREVFNAVLMPQIAAAGLQKRAKLIAVNQVSSEERAAVKIQAAWRGAVQRRQFLAHLKEKAAAVCIQKCVRGMLAKKEAAARRQHLAELQEKAVQQTKRRMAELAKVMAQYTVRTAAAKRIQAAWRGYCCRVEYKTLLAEKAEVEAQKAQRRAAAGALIASWGPTFRDRLWFMKARRAAVVLQTAWRRKYAQQNAAAIVIQKNIKAFLAVRHLSASKTAALKIQSAYRGYVVRAGHLEAEHLRGIRTRLRAAGIRSSQRTIGSRTAAALEALSSCSGRTLPSFAVLEDLAYCTEASLTSCTLVVETGALKTLLSGAVASGRDKKTLGEPLKWALQCIANVCSCRSLVNNVFYSCLKDGSITQLVDLLQQLREREEPFMATLAILNRLTADESRGSAVREQKPELVARLEGIARLLNHKRAAAATYLSKLEAQKGSDVSARQATRGLVSVAKQLTALGKVLDNVGAQDLNELLAVGGTTTALPGVDGNRRASGVVVPLVRGKNTIVRAALAEISNKN